MKDKEIREALITIDEAIRSAKFNQWRRDFVNKYVNKFTFDDENKLEYSEIHQLYENEIETLIADGLPKDFDMQDFMSSLPDYIDQPEVINDNQIGKAITLLLEVSDFQQFKSMMLFTKREREEEETKHNDEQLTGLKVSSNEVDAFSNVNEMMGLCASLSSAASDDDGWENLLNLDWMKIDKKPVPIEKRKNPKDIYLRGIWTLNLTFVECCDMMFSISERRKKWDSNFTSATFPKGGSDLSDDVIISVDLSFGYLVNLVMFGNGNGTKLTTRNIRKWDIPTPGSVCYAMVPYNLKLDTIDEKHPLLSLKTGTISPHPTFPDKVVMTSLEINTMGGMVCLIGRCIL